MQPPPIMLPPGMAGNERYIVLIPAPKQPRSPPEWNTRCAKGLGITFILIAVIAVACNIGWFAIPRSLAPVSIGFWAGALVLVTGILLTVSGFRPSRCLIVSVLIMSIITNVFESIGFIVVGSIQLSLDDTYMINYEGNSLPPNWDIAFVRRGFLGFGILFLLLGILCFALLLTASILSCISLCSRRKTHQNVAYIPQAMVFGQSGIPQNLLPGTPIKLQPPAMDYAVDDQPNFQEPPPYYSQ